MKGRRALLLSPLGYLTILGRPEDEADGLFEEVVAHTLRPEFCFDHSWTENDLVLWDDRRTLHYATRFPVVGIVVSRATEVESCALLLIALIRLAVQRQRNASQQGNDA